MEDKQRDERRQEGVVEAEGRLLGQQPEGQVLHGSVLADAEAACQVKQ